jgi:hypothetical protein
MLDVADIWAARTGKAVRLVSANDHAHSRGSAHYEGLALDFHASDPDGLAATFRSAGYRVLWKVPGHYGHVHVEKAGAFTPGAPASTTGRGGADGRRSRPEATHRLSRTPDPLRDGTLQ